MKYLFVLLLPFILGTLLIMAFMCLHDYVSPRCAIMVLVAFVWWQLWDDEEPTHER